MEQEVTLSFNGGDERAIVGLSTGIVRSDVINIRLFGDDCPPFFGNHL